MVVCQGGPAPLLLNLLLYPTPLHCPTPQVCRPVSDLWVTFIVTILYFKQGCIFSLKIIPLLPPFVNTFFPLEVIMLEAYGCIL